METLRRWIGIEPEGLAGLAVNKHAGPSGEIAEIAKNLRLGQVELAGDGSSVAGADAESDHVRGITEHRLAQALRQLL